MVRRDDTPETVRHRLEVFHQETEALKGFYQKLGKLRLIEGNQPIEDVTRDFAFDHQKVDLVSFYISLLDQQNLMPL